MKMKKLFVLTVCLMAWMHCLSAGSALTAGDIAFVAINSDGSDDRFAFVLLSDVEAGTEIKFTDYGWNHSVGFNISAPGDSWMTWTTAQNIPAGEVVVITTDNGNSLPTANLGTVTGNKMLISIAGDQLFAFQGELDNPNFIAGISFNQDGSAVPGDDFDGSSTGNSTTALPEGLTMGMNAVHVYHTGDFLEQDNSIYTGSLTSGSKNELLEAINNRNNWQGDDDTPYSLNPVPWIFVVVNVPTGASSQETSSIQCYPNPVKGTLNISAVNGKIPAVKLYDASGTLVLQSAANSIDMSSYAQGIYVIEVDGVKTKIVKE
jgi:hypothetical protein